MTDEQEIGALVDRLDSVWSTGDSSTLQEILHKDAYFRLSEMDQCAETREQYIQLWKDFLEQTRNHLYRVQSRTVTVWGDTALVKKQFELSFLLERDRYTESGCTTMVFARSEGRWRLVWNEVCARTKKSQ